MKYAITISDMTAADLAAVTAFLNSKGAENATLTNGKGRQAVAELAAAAGATPSTPPAQQQPAPPVVTGDPFAAPPANIPAPPASNDPGTPQVTPAAGEIDSKGIPYNPEFHAESRRKNNDGSWAKRKGVDKAGVAAYEARFAGRAPSSTEQINAAFGVTTPPNGHTVVTAPPASTVAAPPAADPFAAPAAQPAVPAPAPQTPPAPPAAAAAPREVTYNEWFTMYNNLLTAGKMTPQQYSEIATRYGALDNSMVFMNDNSARARSFAEFEALAAA